VTAIYDQAVDRQRHRERGHLFDHGSDILVGPDPAEGEVRMEGPVLGIKAGLLGGEEAELSASVLGFLEERARHLFRESHGFAYDEVNAVFAAGWDDLVDTRARLEASAPGLAFGP